MKKRILTILLLVCLVLTTVPTAVADNDWYTYTYNFWGDETASPDAYSVENIFYGRNFGEGVGTLNDPEGMFVMDDLVYICDTKNNRIVELQYNDGVFETVRIIKSLQVSVDMKDTMKLKNGEDVVLTLSEPYDIFVKKITPEERAKIYGDSYLGELYVPEVKEEPVEPGDSEEPGEPEDGEPEDGGDENGETPDASATTSDNPDGGENPDGEDPDGLLLAPVPNGDDAPVTTAPSPGNNASLNDVRKELNRDYDFYIADTKNERIIHCDYNLNVIGVIKDPKDEDATQNKEVQFLPQKFVVDDAYRYYVQAKNVNSGIMEFNKDGDFNGYIGATPVSLSFFKRLWRLVQTSEQAKRSKQYVPTEYNNIALDQKGFMYVTTSALKDEEYLGRTATPIRKLNSMGSDILIRNGNQNPIGDLNPGKTDNKEIDGYSAFVDVVTFENETYCCLDRTRGRLFVYDFQGNMLYAFGNSGMNAGCFVKPVAVDKLDEKTIIVLDRQCGTLTVFAMSKYGSLVNEALALYRRGLYDESADVWREVLKYNGNYDLAYVGVGRSYLRQGRYKDAMDQFEVVRDSTNYSKAFKYYREQVVEKNIVWVIIVLAALLIVPKAIRAIIKLRKEIKEA